MMNDFLKKQIVETKGKTYINSIPIQEFENLNQLIETVKIAKKNGLGVNLCYETSNFHQGVLCQLYDKNSCTNKEYL